MRTLVLFVLLACWSSCLGCSVPDNTRNGNTSATPPLSDSGKDGEIGAPSASPEEWKAGALLAAESLGCHGAVWQLPGESFNDAVAVYARTGYDFRYCLILQPTTRSAWYFLGYAGQFEGEITNDIPANWPGVPVYYLSDDLHGKRL